MSLKTINYETLVLQRKNTVLFVKGRLLVIITDKEQVEIMAKSNKILFLIDIWLSTPFIPTMIV